MRRRAWLALIVATVLARRAGAQHEQTLQRIDDLRAEVAQIERLRAPLLLLFSTPGCPYCRDVRRNYLMPRVVEERTSPRLLIREVEITSERTMTDLDGSLITERQFARRFDVRVVPVVAVFDSTLALLDEPLVGLDRSGFYDGYLTSMIDRAQARMRR